MTDMSKYYGQHTKGCQCATCHPISSSTTDAARLSSDPEVLSLRALLADALKALEPFTKPNLWQPESDWDRAAEAAQKIRAALETGRDAG